MKPDDIDTKPIRKSMAQRRDEDAAMFRVAEPTPPPVMQFTGALRVYFNRLGAAPMMWCISPEPLGDNARWELAVRTVRLCAGVVAETIYQPKATPGDEDGRPSGWIATDGHLRIYADGTATVTRD